MKKPPEQGPCGCGAKSVKCVHGADAAIWMCEECFRKLMKLLGRT